MTKILFADQQLSHFYYHFSKINSYESIIVDHDEDILKYLDDIDLIVTNLGSSGKVIDQKLSLIERILGEKDLPIIVFTGGCQDVDEIYKLGVKDIIPKPKYNDLKETIDKYL
jgi:heptaprenylglyceryl phosphate synthase